MKAASIYLNVTEYQTAFSPVDIGNVVGEPVTHNGRRRRLKAFLGPLQVAANERLS